MGDSYVVVDIIGKFWTGAGWSAEYPDAELYESFRAADAAARKAKGSARSVVRNYGTDREDCLRTHSAI